MTEYPLNSYKGVCGVEHDRLIDLAEQEKWEELMEALVTNRIPINKARNMEKPDEENKEEQVNINSPSLKYLGNPTRPGGRGALSAQIVFMLQFLKFFNCNTIFKYPDFPHVDNDNSKK